ncbi:hypothetical protein D8674_000363 [Pyrus ussuriensis x Pyrus communis]|uniref:Uncharacterized protein n=1 Tax=Pyrus ussuriensis x Pyrus communis TaxID=2448454 RepID=A0A5N5F3V5_9ROSA|nr:hypothetical protein D8674_000363 [Pyrus ussuriensis x Pyrus communis]
MVFFEERTKFFLTTSAHFDTRPLERTELRVCLGRSPKILVTTSSAKTPKKSRVYSSHQSPKVSVPRDSGTVGYRSPRLSVSMDRSSNNAFRSRFDGHPDKAASIGRPDGEVPRIPKISRTVELRGPKGRIMVLVAEHHKLRVIMSSSLSMVISMVASLMASSPSKRSVLIALRSMKPLHLLHSSDNFEMKEAIGEDSKVCVGLEGHYFEADWFPIQVSVEKGFRILTGRGHLISPFDEVRTWKSNKKETYHALVVDDRFDYNPWKMKENESNKETYHPLACSDEEFQPFKAHSRKDKTDPRHGNGFPDYQRPLYMEGQINDVFIIRALVDTSFPISILPLAVLTAASMPTNNNEETIEYIKINLKIDRIRSSTKFYMVYHALLGRPWINKHRLVTLHLPLDGSIAVVEKLEEVNLSDDHSEKKELVSLLKEFKDVFSCCYEQMPCLDPNLGRALGSVEESAKEMSSIWVEDEPQEMCIQCFLMQVPGLPNTSKRHRCRSREGAHHRSPHATDKRKKAEKFDGESVLHSVIITGLVAAIGAFVNCSGKGMNSYGLRNAMKPINGSNS